MPVVLSKASGTAFAVGLAAVAIAIRNAGERVAEPRLDPKAQLFVARAGAGKGRDKVAVDKVFAKRMWRLLKILVPGPLSPEFGFASLTALLMVARTWCDVWMISKRTSIEAKIIAGNNKAFMAHLTGFVLGLVPIAVVTSMLKYSLSELAMRFRTRLTNHLITEYMRGHTSYKIANVDNRISNADQLLTQDAMLFCNSVADLYSNVSKPLLDMGLYTYKLSGAIGMQGPGNMLAYLAVSGVALTWLRRPVGRFTVNEQKLEGEYRYVHSRLITHSEEVAFYNGNEREKWVVETVFERLMHHVRRAQQFRFSLGVIDTIVAKYFATVVGFWVVSRPFFKHSMPAGSPIASMTHAQRLEAYYESGRMLLNLAMAVGRLVLAGREMTRLAGFTARVTQLMDVLDDLNNGRFQRTMVGQSSDALAIKDKAKAKAKGAAGGAGAGPDGKAPEDDGGSGSGAGGKDRRPRVSSQINEANMGEIVYQDHIIRFEDVPLKTPNNDTLVESLSFEVRSGMNVLVAGPNGCGKSSLFRILGELWPLFGGRMVKPDKRHLFYIPQKPFMTLGTLRDQIIYPMAKGEMAAAGLTDADIRAVLAEVHLSSLEEREGGFDAVQDWADVLSGGEKQRVAMARLFVHKPQFAILDECTSAVSVDVEGYMYRRCRELNITLFTVSHRQTLWKFHEYLLRFDGRGKYEYRPIEGAEVFGS